MELEKIIQTLSQPLFKFLCHFISSKHMLKLPLPTTSVRERVMKEFYQMHTAN